jgi:hypothetical protein
MIDEIDNKELEIEIREKKRIQELFNELCLWLNKAEKGFLIEYWGSGEGKHISLDNIEIEFYDTGYIDFKIKEKNAASGDN